MDNYIVSARKYRPMTFSSVVGQEALTTTLKNAVRSGKLAHAYLFCGPRGVGKTTCARIFAKTINCEHPTTDGEACDTCESCRSFNEGRSMNIFELDAASNNSVENIKTLMDQTLIPPQTGRYKVFIIDEVHMLSTAAFNAFLKTLEEPPHHVIFVLATTEKHKILPTILSRCQIYDFERMAVPEIIGHLKMVADKEGIGYEEEALSVIAEKADGGMRDALSIFDQVASFCQGNITYQKVLEDLNVLDADNYFRIIDLALANQVSDIMLLLDGLVAKGFDAGHLINGLASHVRNVLMARDAQTLPLLEASQQQRLRYQEQAKKCPIPFLYKALRILNECDVNYRQSSNKRLLAELTLIRVAQITQPEDDDTAGAGRCPKRLKTLFKNIKTSQPITASQVAGDGTTTQPAAQVQSRPETSSPTLSSPGHTTATEPAVGPITPPAAPGTPTDKPAPIGPRIKLRNIGMTFNDLRRGPEQPDYAVAKTEEASPAPTPDEARRFTEAELGMQWTLMCNRMPQQLVGLAARLKNLTPHIADYPNIEVVLDNEILLGQINEIKGSIRATMRKTLGNADIDLTLRLADPGDMRRVFTKRELFDELRQRNPAIEKLREHLGLELA
ncbi:DNA polymerase III, subunit gamma/tau [Prevotella dentalis DSM 3688]|uniref:DNA polymerase III subunit gamma/tau n=1 Tax=Prevotella dentalis (strain ATCC 49559 / DSM 3688 / JCM 13448 / NCTC 12043 / ES 2772) TaxID=908937 RepID=F9D0A8_PREDD|nr:DNA polymerase III subunit gamma/tau [Prevotella dentalis]AGB27856.1 DNA polymerase III, subunit gamma/tau [Prevotella dentalis DSM 3688]EGQ17201.1 DNA polymerase III, gamma/tau subunit DnaX [Prevotella dentalis DSM 3688]